MTDTKSLIGQINKIPSRIWDVYKKPDVRVDIEDYTYVFNAAEGRNPLNEQVDFEISNQDLGVYIYPADSFLEMRLRVVNGAGAKINGLIAIQNHVMNAYSRAELEIDDVKVEEIKEPGIVYNAKNLIEWSPDHEKTASLWGWAKDGGPATVANEYTAADTNLGFLRRKNATLNGRQKTFWVPLREIFPFFNHNRMVLRGQNIKVTLTKNSNTALIFHKANGVDDGVLDYKRVGIHWATVKPDPSTSLILERKLASGTKQSLLWDAVSLHKSEIFGNDDTDIEFDFTVQKGVPQRIIILPYLTSQFASQEVNTVQWPNLSIRNVQVKLNSKNYPQKQLKLNFVAESEITGEAYLFYLKASGMLYDRGGGSLIHEREWANHYRIYVINFEKEESVFDPKRNWEISVEIGLITPGSTFRFYSIVESTRKATLQGLQGKLNFEN